MLKEKHTVRYTHRQWEALPHNETHTHTETPVNTQRHTEKGIFRKTHTLRYKQTQTLRMRHIEPHERHIDRRTEKHRLCVSLWENTERKTPTYKERETYPERDTHIQRETHTQWYIPTHTVRDTHTLRDTYIALISHASKIILKIFQARLQDYVNHDIPDV